MRIGRIAAGLVVLAAPCQAMAQAQNADFSIPAGTLDQALRTYAKITGQQILYRPDVVEARRFSGMRARLGYEAALVRIIAGSGLIIERPSRNVIVLRRSDTTSAQTASAADGLERDVPDTEIVVTGSNIRGGNPTVAVRTIDRRELERSGRATVADVIADQTANFGGSGNPVASLTGADGGSLNYSVAPAANLRGLGTDATLTLFDGRRVAGSGGRGDFTDLSAIPSLAVDRVEILADGASAIYGSDAVGGVVNVQMRHRFDGVDTRLRGSVMRGGGINGLVGLAAGKTWNTGAVFIAYEYEHRARLSSEDRDYTATGDLRPFGGTDRRTYLSSPGTILALDPAAGTFVPAFRIPVLAQGVRPTVADLVPGSNLGNLFAGVDLSPRVDRHAAYGRIEQKVSADFDVFADVRYARRTFEYLSPAAVSVLVVTPANPYYVRTSNLGFEAIGYSFTGDLGASRVNGGVSALSASGGFAWKPGGGWTVDGYGSFARERSREVVSNQLNSTALSEALGSVPDNPSTPFSATRDGYFNPYGSGTSNGAAVVDFIGSGYSAASRRSSVTDSSIKAEGPLLRLPGGDVRSATGVSYRRETFRTGGESFVSGVVPTALTAASGKRDIKAVFSELQIPLVGVDNATRGIRTAMLSLAVRHEDYADFGSTTNPKIGLAVQPAAGVTLRGSWGTSFRAPALAETREARRIVPTTLLTTTGVYVPVIVVAGGNPDLGPEKAKSFSTGFTIEPIDVPGLRMDVNVFKTRFTHRIAQPALVDLQRALTNPELSSYVQRISPGANPADLAAVRALLSEPGARAGLYPATSYAAIVDTRFSNTSSLDVAGLDFGLAYSKLVGTSRLGADMSATWLFRYADRLTARSAVVDRIDTIGNPAGIRVRGGLNWSRSAWSAAVGANYVDGYVDNVSLPLRSVKPFFTLDGTIGLAPNSGALRGYRFLLSAQNLLDADPPFADRVNGLGFDAANSNPFGRIVAMEVRRTF